MKKKILAGFLIVALCFVATPNSAWAKIESVGNIRFYDVELSHERALGIPVGTCSKDIVLDLTKYKGQRIDFYDKTFREEIGEEQYKVLECMTWSHYSWDYGTTAAGNGIFSITDGNHWRDSVAGDGAYRFRGHSMVNINDVSGYRSSNPVNPRDGVVFDLEGQGEVLVVPDRYGEWTMSNKVKYRYLFECVPGFAQYDECDEVRDFGVGWENEVRDKISVAKGKIFEETVDMSFRVVIEDPNPKKEGGVSMESFDNDLSVEEWEGNHSQRSALVQAPNTGFFDKAKDFIFAGFSVMFVFSTIFWIFKRR